MGKGKSFSWLYLVFTNFWYCMCFGHRSAMEAIRFVETFVTLDRVLLCMSLAWSFFQC
jgi:hypothetical protein